ncbi:MAG TPA: helix-hairpin-helix domain-containing protein [Candidatus Nanopelagicales bacterium]
MRRTQDLVLARLRLLAMRWRMELPAGAGLPPAAPPGAASDILSRAVTTGPTGAVGDPAGGPGDAASEGSHELSDGAGGAAPSERTPARLWLPLAALLAVVTLGVGSVLLVRAWPRPEPPVLVAPAPSELVASGDPFAPPSPTPAPVVVHVVGEVRHPGVVRLPAGARVGDALAAAGGLRRDGRLGGTNLARPLVDGERVEIGRGVPAAPLVAGAPGGAGDAPGNPGGGQPVDLNTATAEQLDTLPGVGPVTASKVLAWRAAHGRFSSIDELAEVPGIGPKTLEELRPHVRV